jgi:hypothetical protein
MRRLFAILEGAAFALVFACYGILGEVLVIGVLEIAGAFKNASLRPGWVVAVPIIFGLFGFRLGIGAPLEMMMLRSGVTYGNAVNFAYAWVAGVALWAALVWFAVDGGYGPFGEPHWDIGQTAILALVLCVPPTLAVILARVFASRLNRTAR